MRACVRVCSGEGTQHMPTGGGKCGCKICQACFQGFPAFKNSILSDAFPFLERPQNSLSRIPFMASQNAQIWKQTSWNGHGSFNTDFCIGRSPNMCKWVIVTKNGVMSVYGRDLSCVCVFLVGGHSAPLSVFPNYCTQQSDLSTHTHLTHTHKHITVSGGRFKRQSSKRTGIQLF